MKKIIKAPKQISQIQSTNALEDGSNILRKRVIDAREQAEIILDNAHKHAEKLKKDAALVLKQAKNEAEQLIENTRLQGAEQGKMEFIEKVMVIEKEKEAFYANAEPEMISLVMGIAEKIIGQLAVQNKSFIAGVVRQAIDRILGDRIVVKLNPVDYECIMTNPSEVNALSDQIRRLDFRCQDDVSQGGCIVESEVGTIDARLELQLDAIKRALIDG